MLRLCILAIATMQATIEHGQAAPSVPQQFLLGRYWYELDHTVPWRCCWRLMKGCPEFSRLVVRDAGERDRGIFEEVCAPKRQQERLDFMQKGRTRECFFRGVTF
jgi:hypothetical protein